jgi:hypothetical protein
VVIFSLKSARSELPHIASKARANLQECLTKQNQQVTDAWPQEVMKYHFIQ